jgi:prepilin-type processing-associated H-X9-DG protein/prepilin-type N-terminal cleavage/methylation domain-containing protein
MTVSAPELRRHASVIQAFTLLELLAVTVIIGILVAMLWPVLSNTKADGKGVQCLSNLRQMGIAAMVYVNDNADFYPIAYYSDQKNNIDYCWDFTTVVASPTRVLPGLLWAGHGPEQIQQCPSFAGSANWLADPYTGYNYNTSYIGHGQYESIPQPAKNSDILHPLKTVLFGDGQYAGGADKFMRAPWPNPGDADFWGRNAGTQGFRHRNRSNAAYCDGHAASMRACYTNNCECASVYPGTGFLSPDNTLYDVQ